MPLKTGSEPAPHFFLQHGWGFNRGTFNEWPDHIKSGSVTLLDRGYLGGPPRLFAEGPSDEVTVLVSHSLGLHFFSTDQLASVDMLVVLSGFASFHGFQSQDGRISRKHIKRMQRRLRQEPEKLLADFYRDCSWPGDLPDFDTLNVEVLSADLHLLDTVKLQPEEVLREMKVLILHGANDRIVSLERAVELQALMGQSTLQVIDQAGHGLPFTHAKQCLSLITDHFRRL
jgi:pimeloyl-ACP methyl ester carboxylesterase